MEHSQVELKPGWLERRLENAELKLEIIRLVHSVRNKSELKRIIPAIKESHQMSDTNASQTRWHKAGLPDDRNKVDIPYIRSRIALAANKLTVSDLLDELEETRLSLADALRRLAEVETANRAIVAKLKDKALSDYLESDNEPDSHQSGVFFGEAYAAEIAASWIEELFPPAPTEAP